MLDIIQNRMNSNIQESIEKINDSIKGIDLVIRKITQEQKIAEQLFGGVDIDNASNDSDSRIEMLSDFSRCLYEQKTLLISLLSEVDSLSSYSLSDKSSVCKGKICVRPAKHIELSHRFYDVADIIDLNVSKINKVVFEVSTSGSRPEIERMLDALSGYSIAINQLKELCCVTARYFKRVADESMHLDAPFSSDFKSNVSGCDSSECSYDCHIVSEGNYHKPMMSPPPVLASSRPAVEYSKYGENKRGNVTSEGVVETKEKSGLFGFFKRKKQEKVSYEHNNTELISTDSAIRVDSVQFSAVAPGEFSKGEYLPINIIMYEEAFRKAVDDIVQEYGDKAKESKSGYHDVERNPLVRVVLTSCDVMVEDCEEELVWNGKYLNFQFVVKIPSDFLQKQILLSATVYINDVIATKLKLILDCEKKSRYNISVDREDIVSAFVSYASQDRNRVASIIQGMQKARPDMDIFFDIESLRSGQKWEETLKTEIENRDVLFLCWSRYAKESKWVDMEWRYALESKGEDCIEPIPIDSPDVCPPPAELQKKHFNDKMLFIIRATMPEKGGTVDYGTPYLLRTKTNEYLILNKPVLSVGKDEKYADYKINGNNLVSRRHAEIISRDGVYYVKDLNSTNHTYVDEQMIPYNVEVSIHNGTKIKFADEEFVFYINQ